MGKYLSSANYHLELTAIDAAWLAGIIDGEGSIGIYKRKGSDGMRPTVSMTNTDKLIIDRVCLLLKTKSYRSIAKNLKRQAWQLSLQHRKALTALQEIVPYLQGEKKAKALKVLGYYT